MMLGGIINREVEFSTCHDEGPRNICTCDWCRIVCIEEQSHGLGRTAICSQGIGDYSHPFIDVFKNSFVEDGVIITT